MPEGPEVECVKRSLRPIIGKKIINIKLTKLSQKYEKYAEKQTDFDEFSGQIIKQILRLGKFLVFRFNGKKVILNHLGMSGRWFLLNNKEDILPKHSKVLIEVEEPPNAVFDDCRNFGQFRTFDSYDQIMQYEPIKKLGLDGLAEPFALEEFINRIRKKNYSRREIGAVLLDQKLVAGIGNIYKSESLSLANINPLRQVIELTEEEVRKLGKAISKTLQKAVKYMGSTFSTYRTADGEEGSAQDWHQVYQKEGKECQKCGTVIVRIIQNKRSTFYCPKCQI